jgi:peptidoglycan hydrolase-like protein with peptidoglycan-binding domain
LTLAEVKALQAKLQELGFQPGPADGVAGRRTMRAVKAFQRAHGLGATGIIDRQILKAVLDAPARQTSHATSATEAVADAPKAVPGLASDRDDDLLTASERGR